MKAVHFNSIDIGFNHLQGVVPIMDAGARAAGGTVAARLARSARYDQRTSTCSRELGFFGLILSWLAELVDSVAVMWRQRSMMLEDGAVCAQRVTRESAW